MENKTGPLQGVKVVACSTAQAGTVPYMLMADLGADVIKVEMPGTGDPSRTAGELKGHISSFFETNNRGVKSITLNLKTDEGRAILHRLIKDADVFGQNFRPGAAEKNGFGYEELKKITRGETINANSIKNFITSLDLNDKEINTINRSVDDLLIIIIKGINDQIKIRIL